MDYDFLSSLLDEVALEGLDGITLPMLWERLKNRRNFPIALDDESKTFLWECIAVHREIDIYELPLPRPFVPIYNRYDYVDNELEIVLESSEPLVDSYPIEFVNDGNIRGSCSTYSSRVCITSEIRYDDVLLMSLNQVMEKWGEKLVLVASPKVRLLSLIGTETNPLIDLSIEQYCLLERIGRSRYLGEVTQGEGGLLSLKAPFCKQLHYYRKKLTLKGLVTKQLHYMKNKKGQAATGSLFHLTRFYTPRKTRMERLMKRMCDILKQKPNNREQCKVLRELLDVKENTFKKLFYRPFQKCVKIVTIPYRELFPDATLKEKQTANGVDKVIKVVQLIKHCDEVDDMDYDEIPDEKEKFLPLNVHFDFSKMKSDVPMLSQIYKIIQDAGPEGITSASLGRIITLPRLDIRTLLRELVKKNLLVTVLQERGRQKEQKYIAKKFIVQNEEYFKVKEGEHELSQEKRIADESQENEKSSKRKKPDSLDDSGRPPSKKVRFNDEVNVEKIGENTKHPEEENKLECNGNEVSKISEVQDPNAFTDNGPKLVSLTEIPQSSAHVSSIQLTYRKLKRMEIVLDYLNSVGLSNLTELQKYLIDKEKEEGYNFKLDKKSTRRLVLRLFMAKKLRIYKAVLELDQHQEEHEFICSNSVEPDDSRIQLATEQAKFKFFSLVTEKSKPQLSKGGETSKISDESVIQSKETERKKPSTLFTDKMLHGSKTNPKCIRIKTLHKFLFYLVHNYEGHSGDHSKKPVVFHDSMTWKRFVPPLRSQNPEGWCFFVDVYIRMPLSIFVKVFNVREKIECVAEYLNDEEKCHYLLTDLPQDKVGKLFKQRRYLFAFDEVLKFLCYMGLISFGPQTGKLKQEVFVYIHKKAALKDTTISTPGYIHINNELSYEKKIFSFNTLDDVEKFWMEVESISFHTPLGKYSSVVGKTIAIVESNHKPELLEASKNKNFDEISDVGDIPGDGLGAGGFDSSLFLHSRRNWQSTNTIKSNEKSKTDIKSPTISIQNLLNNKEMLGPDGRSRLHRLQRYRLTAQKDKVLKEGAVKKGKSSEVSKKSKPESIKPSIPAIMPKKRRRMKLRTVKMRNKKIRQPYFDEKDRVAMQKMSRARCEWFAQEDSFLLLCKVASSFLDPSSRTLVVPYTVIRDLLHEKFPELSANKSSRACQRRVRYMMMNSTTANNVAVFLGEAKQDKNLVKEFDRAKPAKTNEAVWKELFTGVLKRLLEKFTLPAADRCKNITLPNSKEVFDKTFEIMPSRNVFLRKNSHKNPESEDEIVNSALYALIVSAMAIGETGTEWSYLLYKLYQAYPEYILRSVVSRLRNEKVIAVKKRTCKKDLQRSLMSTFPYRFSITYENALMTKFPIKLFNESKELVDILKSKDYKDGLELKGNVAPGYAAAVLALMALNELELSIEIPDQIILFDSSLSQEARSNIVERMINTLSDTESVEFSELLNEEESSLPDSEKKDENAISDQPLDSFEKKSRDTYQSNEVQRSTNASRFALYLLRQELSQPPIERVQHSQDYIVLNSCKVFCHLKSPVNSSTSSGNSEVKQNISHLTKDSSEPRARILTDGCISEIKQSLTAFIPSEAFSEERNFEESLEKMYDAYSAQTLNDAKNIFEEILKTGSIGITEKLVWEKFEVLNGELSVFEHLHLFREAMLVIRAGVATFVYVCLCYAKSWVLTSHMLPEICHKKKFKTSTVKNVEHNVYRNSDDCEMTDLSEKRDSMDVSDDCQTILNTDDIKFSFQDPGINFTEEIHFLPRTWRHPDGTLNKKVFIELLQTVLSYIISSPGVNVSRVTEHFSLVLQPVQTLELLEILEKACCITKYYIKKLTKTTLFSKWEKKITTKTPNPNDLDHLEPLPDAVINLAALQEAILQV